MKKYILFLISTILIVVIYFFTKKNDGVNLITHKKVTDSKKIEKSESNTLIDIPKSLEIGNKKNNPIKETQSEDERDFEVFEIAEENWLVQMKDFFGDEKKFQIYMMFRDSCEKEKLEAYEEYHKYLEAKYGKNYSYSLSEDNTRKEEVINGKYLEKIKKLVGDQNFIKYLEIKDKFNKDLSLKMVKKRTLQIEI